MFKKFYQSAWLNFSVQKPFTVDLCKRIEGNTILYGSPSQANEDQPSMTSYLILEVFKLN